MREFKVGDIAYCMMFNRQGVISKIQIVNNSVYCCIGHATFHHIDELEIVYKDMHTPMVYGKISDSKAEAMASSETIEAIEQMMDPL